MSSIEQGIWREILTHINEATVNGLLQAKAVPTHNEAFLSALRHSNEVFAAFKVHALQQEVAAKLLTPDGRLKSFAEFRRDVEGITSHQCGAWLQTEYDTAVIRAHNAADWQVYEANRDIMSNLRWLPTTSVEPEAGHRAYWVARLNLPMDDSFWQHHHPGDHWNCKCSLEQNNDPVCRPADIPADPPQPGLDNNPGKDGHTFSDNHPYFPSGCSSCPFNKGIKNTVQTLFKNQKKHCYQCDKVNNAMMAANNELRKAADVLPPAIETYGVSHGNSVFTSPYHGANEVNENKRLAAFIADKIDSKVYLLPRLDPDNPIQAPLRSKLHPEGVPDKKNPDFYILGKLFDGKSMMGIKRTNDNDKYHNAILNRIKSAKEQADNAVLEIPTFVSRKTISSTIKGFLMQSSRERIIIVKHGKKCYIYNSKYYKKTGYKTPLRD